MSKMGSHIREEGDEIHPSHVTHKKHTPKCCFGYEFRDDAIFCPLLYLFIPVPGHSITHIHFLHDHASISLACITGTRTQSHLTHTHINPGHDPHTYTLGHTPAIPHLTRPSYSLPIYTGRQKIHLSLTTYIPIKHLLSCSSLDPAASSPL